MINFHGRSLGLMEQISSVFAEAAPVVDIDNTVFIQGAIFLALVFILKPLLFDPWLAARDRRVQRIGGAMEEAKLLHARAADTLAQYEVRLRRAKDQAIEIRSERRREAELEEANIVAEARTKASATLEKNRLETDAAIASARSELQGRVGTLAAEVTAQVLGRPA